MTARATPPLLTILADTREQTIPPFPAGIIVERVTMAEADYTTPELQGIAVVERKSIADFASSITHDRERLDDEVRRLLSYRWKAIVIEGEIGEVWRANAVHPHAVIGTIASFFARADLPCLFAGSAAGAGRMIAGLLRRWEERLTREGGKAA